MPVTEVRQALGEWSINLIPGTPREILDFIAANPFGHIAIVPGPLNSDNFIDQSIWPNARYIGVFRSKDDDDDGYSMSGSGLMFWAGDEDGKGPVIPAYYTSTNNTFQNTVAAWINAVSSFTNMLGSSSVTNPSAATATINPQFQTVRDIMNYTCDLWATDPIPVSWFLTPIYVTNLGIYMSLTAGPDSVIFGTTPKTLLVRSAAGRDMSLTGLTGALETGRDWTDYTTQVLLLTEGTSVTTLSASASFTPPYYDMRGNLINFIRPVSESETTKANATSRATLQLNRFKNPNRTVQLSSTDYDVRGDIQVGAPIYVFDPDLGFVDTTNEVYWQGQMINPASYRVQEMTWPIEAGWTVAFRGNRSSAVETGSNWVDLTPYFVPEAGETTIIVGDTSSTVTQDTTARSDANARFNALPRIYSGQVDITPSAANTPTKASITFPAMGGTVFRGYASCLTTVPGSTVTGQSVTNITSTSADIWVTRTNTTTTTVNYLIIGSDS